MNRRVKILLLFSFLGFLVGVIKAYQEPVFQVYRLFILHDNNTNSINNSVWVKDNVLRLESTIIARTYSKYSTPLDSTKGKVSEMKLYIPESASINEVFKSLQAELNPIGASIYRSQYQYNTIDRNSIFHYLVLGLFLGILINFFMSLGKP